MYKSKQDTIQTDRGSPCCVCRGIPSHEVRYEVQDGGATRIERYMRQLQEKKGIEMEINDKLLLLDFEKYLEKKRRKIGNASHGFDRGYNMESSHRIVITGRTRWHIY